MTITMETSQSQMVVIMKKPKEVKGMRRVGLESLNLEIWGKPPKDVKECEGTNNNKTWR